MNLALYDSLQRHFLAVRNDFCVDSTATLYDAEYRLLIEGTHGIDGNKTLRTISEITRYIIPSSERGSIELDARLYRGDEEIKRYRVVGAYKVRWFLLILAVPWMWNSGVPGDVVEDAFRDLFIQVQNDAPQVFASPSESSS